jgi:hypothetical protein
MSLAAKYSEVICEKYRLRGEANVPRRCEKYRLIGEANIPSHFSGERHLPLLSTGIFRK